MTMFMRMANVTCVCLMAGVALVVTGCERAKKSGFEAVRFGEGINETSNYVVVPNLNRRQSVGELAGPDTLRFDSLQELDLFVKTRLGPYELYSVWDVDSDPTGRYALVK